MSRCEELVVTIYNFSDETNAFDDSYTFVSPTQDSLFKVHDKVVSEEVHSEDFEEASQVTVQLLVTFDQIRCVIGKSGQIIQNIYSESGAQIYILKNDHLLSCALSFDELVQISGERPLLGRLFIKLHLFFMIIHPDPNTCLLLLCPLDTHLVVHSLVQLLVLQSWV